MSLDLGHLVVEWSLARVSLLSPLVVSMCTAHFIICMCFDCLPNPH